MFEWTKKYAHIAQSLMRNASGVNLSTHSYSAGMVYVDPFRRSSRRQTQSTFFGSTLGYQRLCTALQEFGTRMA
eukprot:scaffold3953_cov169-Amphora_coffeaeformis.AAC.10